ncbi:zinc finger MYM-type protein 1-like [Venturia canescens]|uniref:zinc finger MYM-type protein 1-like n=1 Tax=Venturia canescens TaxID=32260 RepID=UPI001C9BCFD0|nr:zinc finger MYM-type protein 1-like [Venturia canescens]XP_043281578.1 zinc finger MYM-type protein 1-like [Venturia canescens]XP_043286923.1 zinc finger MYM-type protein 1-like [Venturia canescens]
MDPIVRKRLRDKSCSDSSITDDEDTSRQKKKSSRSVKVYKQKFKEEWRQSFGKWLICTEDKKPRCTACNKNLEGGYSHIKRHAETQFHIRELEVARQTPKLDVIFKKTTQNDQMKQKAKDAELKMVMFLHEHNLPFLLMEHLPSFVKSVCPDSKIAENVKCSRTKATAITKDCLAPEAKEDICRRLKNSVYSLIIDETTDVGTKKSLAIIIRFFDEMKMSVVDRFLGLVQIESATAESIFSTILKCLKEVGIPFANMIGFAADNASTMMGKTNGVQARFRQILPHIFVLGCVCHSCHLCASAAANKLPKSIEDFARSVYNHFSNSSKRTGELAEYQTFVDLKPQKMLRPSQTRWLSLQAAVDRILHHWDALTLYFTNAVFEDNLHSTESILNCLKTPVYKLYLTFLSYTLESVNKLNLEFQSEKPKIQSLNKSVSELFKSMLKNFMQPSYVDKTPLEKVLIRNPHNFLPLNEIYFGAKAEILISKGAIEAVELQRFRTRALDFYLELCSQIQNRFRFNDPMLKYVEIFSPETALNGSIRSIIVSTTLNFPKLFNENNLEGLDAEWRLLPNVQDIKKFENFDFAEFWMKIACLKNSLDEMMFPNLTKLIKAILSLPHSSAAAERTFSQLNLMKTKSRNRLDVDTCEAILHSKALLNESTCYNWQPSSTLQAKKPKI